MAHFGLIGLALSLLPLTAATLEPFRFEVTTVAEDFGRPMGFDLAPDGRIFLIELEGRLSIIDPDTGSRQEAAKLDVFAEQENGLLGITLDPKFEENNWVYLLYSPKSFSGQHISRFTLSEEKLDPATEKVLLKWETQRDQCCHHGGMLLFGPDGCLYATAGDNTHPFGDSKSYAPIDRRPGREPWNAEKSAGNPNDLRGGIIRIRPKPDGTYEVPDGNLFPPGTPGTRPEIYVMGCRNPWKFSIDHTTGHLYWGEVGPDARGDGPRGPRGYDEINQARRAGNFGWPYFIADNQPYAFVDFANGTVGAKYDPAKPINDSPFNTGRQDLPPAQSAFIYWPYNESAKWPALGQGGRTACAGPIFRFQESFKQSGGFPKHFDNCLLIWDWNRPFIKWARLDQDSNLVGIEEFDVPVKLKRPSDAKFAPDGTLYFLDYGSTWHANKDAKLLHLSYRRGNLPPVANLVTKPTFGTVPLTVHLDATTSTDPEGQPLEYAWTIQSGKTPIAPEPKTTISIDQPGDHLITLTVTDPAGASASSSILVVAGNTPPAVAITQPLDGSFYEPGKPIEFKLHITDEQDGDSELTATPFAASVVTLAPRRRESPGLAAIRSSDCFNCHHTSQKLVGPSFTEIATRYKNQPEAFEQSVHRVRNGSTNVWGPAPMLPHPHLNLNEARSMVRWIYDLDENSAPQVARGIHGTIATPNLPASLDLSANFTDTSQSGSSALSGGASIRLHPRQVEAESYDANNGTQTLNSPGDQPSRFLGAINHSHWTEYHRFRLAGSRSVTFRVSSAGPGGTIRLHTGKTTIATTEVAPTGGWDQWQELTVPISKLPDGPVDLRLSFTKPGNQHLFNLDWFRFNP